MSMSSRSSLAQIDLDEQNHERAQRENDQEPEEVLHCRTGSRSFDRSFIGNSDRPRQSVSAVFVSSTSVKGPENRTHNRQCDRTEPRQ